MPDNWKPISDERLAEFRSFAAQGDKTYSILSIASLRGLVARAEETKGETLQAILKELSELRLLAEAVADVIENVIYTETIPSPHVRDESIQNLYDFFRNTKRWNPLEGPFLGISPSRPATPTWTSGIAITSFTTELHNAGESPIPLPGYAALPLAFGPGEDNYGPDMREQDADFGRIDQGPEDGDPDAD